MLDGDDVIRIADSLADFLGWLRQRVIVDQSFLSN
jgi:hypothetical protein